MKARIMSITADGASNATETWEAIRVNDDVCPNHQGPVIYPNRQ